VSLGWWDLPAQMQQIAQRLEQRRRVVMLSIATVWITFAVLFVGLGHQLSRARATAIGLVMPALLASIWIFYVWAWFRKPEPTSPSLWWRINSWIQAFMVLLSGAVFAFASWGMAKLFLRV
jgi:hypothetical protein